MTPTVQQDTLWTKSFVFMCLSNFMMCFAFYLLMPTLPFYLLEVFHTSKGMVGLVLSCYTIAVLAIRPFSGFFADTFSRKPMYIIAYFLFVAIFVGYLLAGVLTMFIAFRTLHGLAFGSVSTSGNTLVIDVMPASRRGEGLGYYGATNNLAMAFGPMVGLFLHSTGSFDIIFYVAILFGSIGLFFTFFVKAPKKIPQEHQALSLDRFILLKGIPAAISLILITIPYGMTNTYIALYAQELGLLSNTGMFFFIMSVGLIFSRISAGKKVDHGQMTKIIIQGYVIVILGLVGEIFLKNACLWNGYIGYALLFVIAFCLGYGYGTLIPALNMLFVNLAPHQRRATANSTYLTSWDIGIGTGIFLGGYLSEWRSFTFMYTFGVIFSLIALFLFIKIVIPHFLTYKLR